MFHIPTVSHPNSNKMSSRIIASLVLVVLFVCSVFATPVAENHKGPVKSSVAPIQSSKQPEPTHVKKPEPTHDKKPEPTHDKKPEPTHDKKPEPTHVKKPEPTHVKKPEPNVLPTFTCVLPSFQHPVEDAKKGDSTPGYWYLTIDGKKEEEVKKVELPLVKGLGYFWNCTSVWAVFNVEKHAWFAANLVNATFVPPVKQDGKKWHEEYHGKKDY